MGANHPNTNKVITILLKRIFKTILLHCYFGFLKMRHCC